MTIYIDVIIFENIIMNYIIIYATGIIYKEKTKIWRTLISSIVGAFYAVMLYLQIWNANSILKILLSIAMVYIAFYPRNLKILFKQLVIFYLTSFLFGGVAVALIYFIKPQEILMKNGIYIGMYPLKIVLLGAIVGFVLVRFVVKIIKNKITKKDLFCNITIEINGLKTELKALIDTGNMLKEPITGQNVIVVEKKSLERNSTAKYFREFKFNIGRKI